MIKGASTLTDCTSKSNHPHAGALVSLLGIDGYPLWHFVDCYAVPPHIALRLGLSKRHSLDHLRGHPLYDSDRVEGEEVVFLFTVPEAHMEFLLRCAQ